MANNAFMNITEKQRVAVARLTRNLKIIFSAPIVCFNLYERDILDFERNENFSQVLLISY